jgi:Ferritin-like
MANDRFVVRCVPSLARIATLESLQEHLQSAIELEHLTIPPYLCAVGSKKS